MKKILLIIAMFLTTSLIAEDSKLPTLKLKDLNKKRVELADFYSKGPILLNFWTLSCEPCKKEMKHLNKFADKYAENGFQIVSINMDTPRSMSKVKAYVKSQKYSFTVLSDPKSSAFRKVGGNVMPYILIVDSKGTILKRHVGYNPGDEIGLEKEIVEILGLDKVEEKVEDTPVEK
jgi:thiol-disulfide isomerase/thioredoxin